MDYLIHNRTELTNQTIQHLDKIKRLQKKLEIATKALNRMIGNPPTNFPDCETYMWEALQALKEIDLIGTSMSQAKEEV
ncbi:MAG: hypothetical protein J6Q39_04155 [Bacteroidales bacterium]|nr:hypothetical protein [Bacteroidales bacterium]